MKKRKITKIKTAFSIDKDIMAFLEKKVKKGDKKSRLVNIALRQVFFNEHFQTADKLQDGISK